MRDPFPPPNFALVPTNGTAIPKEWTPAPQLIDTGEPDSIHWSRYIDALRRNWFLIVAVAALGSAAGFLATRRIEPVYEARASIWINAAGSGIQQTSPIRQPQLFNSVSWAELIKSFSIVDPIVRDLRLNINFPSADSAAFRTFVWQPGTAAGSYSLTVDSARRRYALSSAGRVVERGNVGDSIGRRLGMHWQPDAQSLRPGRTVKFSVKSPRAVSASLVGAVKTSLPQDGQFISMTLSGGDPKKIATTVNAWANGVVSSSATLKKRNLLEFKKLLGEQLALAESQLRQSENDLERFRVNTITLPRGSTALTGPTVAQADPVVTSYFQEKAALDELRSEQQALERIIEDAKGGAINPQAFMHLPAILNTAPQLRSALEELALRRATLRTEQQYLTDANPRIKQLSDGVRVLETQTIPQITRDVLNSIKALQPELDNRVEAGTEQLREIPLRATEEMRLGRRAAAAENLYNSLKARYEEVSIAEAQTAPDLSVLDTAVAPLTPAENQAPRFMLLAILASVGFALALALIRDRLDRTFRYPEQATRELGLSIAGTVPQFKANGRGEYQLISMSQAVESFRSLRLALRYDFPGNAPLVVAVSSPAAGDGKSLVSSNLGLSFASAGSRTLIIDGDVRRGSLHSTFEAQVTPGLVDYLQGDAPLDSIIRTTASENLYLIPRGTRRNRAPELLISDLMTALVRAMRARFDVVIIDSPPLAAGIDAYAVGAAAGSMLIVLRPGVTDRKLAAAKLQILDRLPIRLLGAVVNSVAGTGVYRYYGSEYGYKDEWNQEPDLDLATPGGVVLGR